MDKAFKSLLDKQWNLYAWKNLIGGGWLDSLFFVISPRTSHNGLST